VWEAAEYCPQSALEWLAIQAPRNKIAHAWILQSAGNWVEQFLIAHHNIRVRNGEYNNEKWTALQVTKRLMRKYFHLSKNSCRILARFLSAFTTIPIKFSHNITPQNRYAPAPT
jgi:hypothetical protein